LNISERLPAAQWVLERNLAWIASADSKVAAVVSIDIALLGGLAAAFVAADSKTDWEMATSIAAFVTASIGVFCAAMAMFPRLPGPNDSLIFFGRIAEMTSADYADRLRKATFDDLLTDYAVQIHRNAEIANDKHKWVKRSMVWSFLAGGAWAIAVAMLVSK
jgi:hypothetical protein